jgi:serine/threonine protein kinase
MTADGGIPFGQYTLLRRIARGGMAEVFLAKQRGLEGFDRRVALKRILPHLADSREFVKMFLDEARLAARLTHPNIVHIYEFGKNVDDYFIAMEFVDGVHVGEIAEIAADRPMPWVLLARIAADAASGLHFAHQITDENGRRLGLVHRDISPANILISYSGTAKIVDFGIAKAVEISDQRTNPGMVKGKFTYMSPEQTIGAQLDGRSDVFSLGIVMWELATGKPMLQRGDPGAAMRTIRDGTFPTVESVVPRIPEPLSQAIAWALEVDRDRRATAADLSQALEAYIKASPELATSMQLGAWIAKQFPVVDSDGEQPFDTDDDSPRRTQPVQTSVGPGTVAAPATGVVSVKAIAQSLKSTAPPLIGASLVAQSNPPPDRATVARTVQLDSTPMIRSLASPSDGSVTRAVGDLSEEMARTGVFQPRDPTEFEDTTERAREQLSADELGHGEPALRRLPGLPNTVDRVQRSTTMSRPGTNNAQLPPPRRTSVTAPPPFRTAIPPRSFDSPATSLVTPLPSTLSSVSTSGSGSAWSEPAPRTRLPNVMRPRRWPWIVAVITSVVVAIFLARHCTANNSASVIATTVDAATVSADAAPAAVDATTDATVTIITPRVDDAVTVELPILPDVAVIEIASNPSNAQVTLGDRTGTTPARFETRAGKQLLVIELSGFQRQERYVTATLGEKLRVDFTLEQIPATGEKTGHVLLRSIPNSEVFENNRSLGKTPLDIDLPLGTHLLSFRAPRFALAKQKIVVKGKQPLVVNVRLTK